VTAGVDWLTEGADDELPVFPVLPVFPLLPDEEEPPPAMEVPVEPDPDDPDRALPEAFPGWSWDTTIPMAAVAPMATRTTPRVSLRSRVRAFSLFWGVFGWRGVVMCSEYLCSGASPSEHGRIDTVAGPAVDLL